MAKIDSFLVEQNILSILFKKPRLIYNVTSQIKPEYFSDNPNRKQNKAIFMCMDFISRKNDVEDLQFDSMTILSVVSKHKKLAESLKRIFPKQEDFIHYIESLKDSPIDPSNLNIHLEELKKINIANDLHTRLENFNDSLVTSYKEWDKNQITDKVETEILEVTNEYNTDESQVFISANKDIVDRYKKMKPNENGFSGFPMNLDRVNKFSRGLLREGSVTVINAPTKTGKSIFLKSQAKWLAIDNGIPTYLGANEQKIEEQIDRLVQEITGLPTIIIQNRLFNSDREEIEVDNKIYNVTKVRKKVYDALQTIEDAPLYLDKISGYTPSTLVQRARYFKKRHGASVFIWDYVKESSSTTTGDGNLRFWLSEVVRTLKEEIADNLGMAVLTAAQSKTYEYWMSAESYGIEKFSTAFCLLRKLENKEKQGFSGDYAFTIKSNRYGREHSDFRNEWISLDLNEEKLRFEEVEY